MNGFSSLCFILPQINAKNTAAQGITAMNTRIALIGIIVEDLNSTDKINEILHNHSQFAGKGAYFILRSVYDYRYYSYVSASVRQTHSAYNVL